MGKPRMEDVTVGRGGKGTGDRDTRGTDRQERVGNGETDEGERAREPGMAEEKGQGTGQMGDREAEVTETERNTGAQRREWKRLLGARQSGPVKRDRDQGTRGGGQRPAREPGTGRQGEGGQAEGRAVLETEGQRTRVGAQGERLRGSEAGGQRGAGTGQDRGGRLEEAGSWLEGVSGLYSPPRSGPVRGWGGCGTVAGPAPPPHYTRLPARGSRPALRFVPGENPGPAPRALFPASAAPRPPGCHRGAPPPRPGQPADPRPRPTWPAAAAHSSSSGHWKRRARPGGCRRRRRRRSCLRPGTCTTRAARPAPAPRPCPPGGRAPGPGRGPRGAGAGATRGGPGHGERAPLEDAGSRRRG